MKFSSPTVQDASATAVEQKISFPAGLVGFPQFTQAELFYNSEEMPFMWLRGTAGEKLSFIVVEPAGLVPGYDIEIADSDVEALNLQNPADAMILNIATVVHGDKGSITLNLIGPIVINRRTLQARQVIITNAQKYSARHLLFSAQTKEG